MVGTRNLSDSSHWALDLFEPLLQLHRHVYFTRALCTACRGTVREGDRTRIDGEVPGDQTMVFVLDLRPFGTLIYVKVPLW